MNSLDETIQNAFSTISLGSNKTEALNELRYQYGNLDIEAIREILMPYVAKIYGVPLTRSQSPRNYGSLSLDNSHFRYEVARKMLYRLALKIKS